MKTLSLFMAAVLFQTMLFAQAKFYTNNGSKAITELNTSITDLKVTLPVLEDFKNYDYIDVQYLETDRTDDGVDLFIQGVLTPGYVNKRYKVAFFEGKLNFSLWIAAPNNGENDFLFEVDHGAKDFDWNKYNDSDREFTSTSVKILVHGVNYIGQVWKHDRYVDDYDFKNIAEYKIKKEYGEIPTALANDYYQVSRYTNGQQMPKIDLSGDELSAVYSSEADTRQDPSQGKLMFMLKRYNKNGYEGTSIEGIKEAISNKLYINSNGKNGKRIPGQKPYISFGNFLYEPFVMMKKEGQKSSKGGKMLKNMAKAYGVSSDPKKTYAKNIQALHDALPWGKSTLGNSTCEKLKIEVYAGYQYNMGEDSFSLKDTEKGKPRILTFYLTENENGIYLAYSVSKHESELPGDEQAFLDHLVKGIKIL